MAVSSGAKGTDFIRYIIARALGDVDPGRAAEIASARWGPGSAPARMIKAATPGLTTDSDLAASETETAEFMSLISQRSIIGRLAGLRRAPGNIRILEQLTGTGSGWIGQGAAIPITAPTFSASTLALLAVSAATGITEDLARNSSPEAEALIRADVLRVVVEELDTAFVDPANSGTANVKPASITNGITALMPTATIGDDLKALIADFDGDLTRAYFIARPDYAAGLTSGAYPNVGARGGELLGVPVLTSRSAPDGLILVDPGRVAVVEDGVDVKVSRQGSVQMDSAPTNDSVTPTATSLVSLWQNNSVGIAAVLRTNWRPAAGAVSMLAAA